MKEDIIIHPIRGKNESKIPANGIMLVTPGEAKDGHELLRLEGGKKQFLFNSGLTVSSNREFFIAGPSVGAPLAAMTMEKLIALGARNIILYGWCGAFSEQLEVGDVVIGGKPEIGEGTSQYYTLEAPPVPSQVLCSGMANMLKKEQIDHSVENVWTTDAPYREDRIVLDRLHRDADVCCVDMEYSALCSVANFREIQFAGLFLVSDELYRKQWKPGFKKEGFKEKSMQLVRLLADLSRTL